LYRGFAAHLEIEMKRILFVALAALAFLATGANAATASSTFNVNLTLTPKCYVNMAGSTPGDVATTDVTLNYTAFQTSDATASTAFTVRCTNTFPYSIAVTADTATVAGINYYLKLAAGSTASYTNATGAATLSTQAGDGTAKPYAIGVSAPSGQAGTCTAVGGDCTASQLHTITVTY
jgi:hypothetical protein